MTGWLFKMLRPIYKKLPVRVRPVLRGTFYWLLAKSQFLPVRCRRAVRSGYERVPVGIRSHTEDMFHWLLIRCQSVVLCRGLYVGRRVEFLDFDIANLESYEFVGPGAREVLVETSCSVVNPGTERAILCGFPGIRQPFPYRPGSSGAGMILKVGRHVEDLRTGDRVAGVIHHVSHESVVADLLLKIPEGVSYVEASFINLGVTVLQGVRKARIAPGDRVVVVGQGLIGQLSNRLARLAGACPVIGIAAGGSRAKIALLPGGADEFIALSDGTDGVRDIQADVVIEAGGTLRAMTTAFECAREEGTVVILGSARGLGRDVDLRSLVQEKRLTLVGAHTSARPERDASHTRWTYRQEGSFFLELLRTGRLQVADLVTWHARPDTCNAVYEVLANDHRGQVGIVFNWQ